MTGAGTTCFDAKALSTGAATLLCDLLVRQLEVPIRQEETGIVGVIHFMCCLINQNYLKVNYTIVKSCLYNTPTLVDDIINGKGQLTGHTLKTNTNNHYGVGSIFNIL